MPPTSPIQAGRQFAPATARNRDAILGVLQDYLTHKDGGHILEIASGTGEHAAYFAPHFPQYTWQPSDINTTALQSINAWRTDINCSTLSPAMTLDVSQPHWYHSLLDRKKQTPFSLKAIVCINMVHISPWAATEGLLNGAGQLLSPGGLLYLYGPYYQQGVETAPSNIAFDHQLQQQNPMWGLRHLTDVIETAKRAGLTHLDTRKMPANNLSVIFRC